jgi:hypothetical protein
VTAHLCHSPLAASWAADDVRVPSEDRVCLLALPCNRALDIILLGCDDFIERLGE